MDFFASELGKKGFARTLGEYIFAPSANYLAGPRPEKNGDPEMLARFISGFLHPLIHTGYGAEFGLLGLSAEGNCCFFVMHYAILPARRSGYDRCPLSTGT
jgi:hypothetical protein